MKFSTSLIRLSPFLIYATGIFYFCLRISGFDLAYIPGDLGDSRFINFLLEHGHHWLTGKTDSFWDADFMYPFKNAIALSDNMLGTVPIYSVWRVFGFSPESAYQLWWVSICSLNYWCCYVVLKKWGFRIELAAMLSWLFAFSLFNLGQLLYMQMNVRFMVPFVFYSAVKMLDSPSLKYFLYYCLGIVIQVYCGMYTGIYLLYFSLLFMIVYMIATTYYKHIRFYVAKQNIMYTAGILVGSVFLVLLVLLPYREISETVGLRWFSEVKPNLPTWKSFLLPHPSSITWQFLGGMRPEASEYWLHYLFTGAVLFLTLLVSILYLIYRLLLKKQMSPLLSTAIICAFLFALLHIKTAGGLTLYGLVFKLPGINSMRVPTRFMHVEIFLLIYIFGVFISRLKFKQFILLFPLLFLDNLFDPSLLKRSSKNELAERKENLIGTIDRQTNKNYKYLAVIDTTQAAFVTHLDAMLVAQAKGVPTLNGYSSYCPDTYKEFFTRCNRNGLVKWMNIHRIPPSDVLIIDHSVPEK